MLSLTNPRTTDAELVVRSSEGQPLARIPGSIRRQIRYLWARLEARGGSVPHSIAVTSQTSGEGVSMTCLTLATVLARAGDTCLVEANWWSEGLDVGADHPGLAGALLRTYDPVEAAVPTSHDGLFVLPPGQLTEPGQTVMTNTEALRAIVERLQERFTYVVIDLPAISTSATTLSFAGAAEATILVVRQRLARIDQVHSAVRDLEHAHLLGIVLNANSIAMPGFLRRRLVQS